MIYKTYTVIIFTILCAVQIFGLPLMDYDESAKICISKLVQSISISDNEKITKAFLQFAILKQCEQQLARIISEKQFNDVNTIREKRSLKKSKANNKKDGRNDKKSKKEGTPVKKSKNEGSIEQNDVE